MWDYIDDCDYVCQHIKAKGLNDFKAVQAAADEYYSAEVADDLLLKHYHYQFFFFYYLNELSGQY